jgi:membrane protein implicated in regulation of membrane protease activity
MPAWLIWLIAAGLLAGAETLSLNFVLIMCAGGAAAGGITAAAGGPAVLQVVVTIVTAVVLLLFIRPVAARHLNTGPTHVSGTAALVGKRAVVSTEVGPSSGLVRLNGQDWSARSMGEGQVYPPGTEVRVVEISGATAIVFEEPFSQTA